METISRQIKDWIVDVERGMVCLPRFQREEVWERDHITKFLWAILKGRPLGVFLVLEVDPKNQPFIIRHLKGAPVKNKQCCRQHLLDGQQRLTALWKSFNDQYDDYIYYVEFQNRENTLEEIGIKAIKKNGKDMKKIGVPTDEFSKNLVPVSILAPGEESITKAINWRKKASPNSNELETLISKIREKIRETTIPYLSLSQDTETEDAIDIFMETNRSSVKLSHYDLAVAQMEKQEGESLQEKVEDLKNQVPEIQELDKDVGGLLLKVRCLFEDRKPTLAGYRELDFGRMLKDWNLVVKSMKWTVEILSDLLLWKRERLPSAVPLRVLPTLYQHIPKKGAEQANAKRLIKKYLWNSFLTERYEQQANDRLKEDYDALKKVLKSGNEEVVKELNSCRGKSSIPAFNAEPYSEKDILESGWPKKEGILSRAILTACSLDGAKDIVEDRKLKKNTQVEYHHIFPRKILEKIKEQPNLSLNCMLLNPYTNKDWKDKWPGNFFESAIVKSGHGWNEAKNDLQKRLDTHLLPSINLIKAQKGKKINLKIHYKKFLQDRAKMVVERTKILLENGKL